MTLTYNHQGGTSQLLIIHKLITNNNANNYCYFHTVSNNNTNQPIISSVFCTLQKGFVILTFVFLPELQLLTWFYGMILE